MNRLGKLALLDVRECPALTQLPSLMPPSLTTLIVNFCANLTGLPDLSTLEVLYMFACPQLVPALQAASPAWRMKTLDLGFCDTLTELPETLTLLVGLKKLGLAYCRALTRLPASMDRLEALEELDLHGCRSLTELPESVNLMLALSKLDIRYCTRLKKLPYLSPDITTRTESSGARSAKRVQ